MGIRMTNIATPMPQLRAKFTNKLGLPLSGGRVYTYEPGTDIHKKTWRDVDKSVENTNPIQLDAAGEADIYGVGFYRVVVKDFFGLTIYDVEKTGIAVELDASFVVDGDKTQKQINDDNIARAFANYTDLRYLNVSPSNNDQTQSVIDALNILSAQGFRDTVYIPKGVRFNAKTVFANLPVGIVLKISDFTNWSNTAGYKNKFDITFSSDLVNDDTQTIIGSGHHPAITLLNTGTSGTVSSNGRYASILHSVGISQDGNPLPAQIMQFRKAGETDDRWCWSLRALISYQIAMKDPVAWVAGKVYAAGDMCLSNGGRVYVTATGGTSGSSAPAGTGAAINDGGVVWDYHAHRKSKDSTTFIHFEDGNTQISGSGEEVGFTVSNGVSGELRARLFVSSTGDVSLRDLTRSRNLISSSATRGIYSDGVGSIRFTNISGATPTLALSGARVINAAAVTMTALNLPAGQVDGMCYLHFVDANTTLQHGGAFQLKDGINVTPPANGFITLLRNGSISGSWFEVSRSF